MYSVSFDLETITPLFMAGADGRTPELRPPSFKGMMRFWWRAMRAEEDIPTLAKNEAALFGGTGEGRGRSRITIRTSGRNLESNSYSPLPHKQARFKIPALKPRQKFKCIICVDERYQEVALSAFKLSVLLGGFGKRSRRGFGALCYRKFDDLSGIMEEIEEANNIISSHVKIYKKETNDIRSVLVRDINPNTPEYPRVHEIYLGHRGSNSPESILKKIGDASHDYRDNALGTIRSRRVASPVIATIVEVDQKFYPIITKLTSHFPPTTKYNINKQDDFIDGVLQ